MQNMTEKNRKPSKGSECLRLFSSFFKIGLFTFGGGYAMIPLIQREAGEKNHWITDDDLTEILAIAESTPGPIAINSATFIGFRTAGFFGAASATLGVVLPSFLVISLLSSILEAVKDNRYVQFAFFGIRAGVLAMIFKALWGLVKKLPKQALPCILAAGALILTAVLKISTILTLILCAAVGLTAALIEKNRRENKHAAA